MPCYDIFVGGGDLRMPAATPRASASVCPRRRTWPSTKVFEVYQAERQEGEEFLAFVDRVGPEFFQPHLKPFEDVGPVHQDMDQYFDWDSQVIFQVIRGEGECAA